MNFLTTLLDRRCRPAFSLPHSSESAPDDFYLEIVAVWLDPLNLDGRLTGHRVMCAVVDVRSGETTEMSFGKLEFEPEKDTEH